jgi:hypothetical protein
MIEEESAAENVRKRRKDNIKYVYFLPIQSSAVILGE